MFSPIRWLRPRLKQFCIAFGIADMSLVILSIICWFFFFDVAYEAQHNTRLMEQGKLQNQIGHQDFSVGLNSLYKKKEDRSSDELRISRTKRACDFNTGDDDNFNIDQDLTGPAALIGASMGSYIILGALLASLSVVEWHAGLKVLCTVCIFGEGASTLFLLIAVSILIANEGMCPTEYFFEDFQPILYIYLLTLIFLCCYKTYEMTIIGLYLAHETKKVREEMALKAARPQFVPVFATQPETMLVGPVPVPVDVQEKCVGGDTPCIGIESQSDLESYESVSEDMSSQGQGDKPKRKGRRRKRRGRKRQDMQTSCPCVSSKGAQCPGPEMLRGRTVYAGNQNECDTQSEVSVVSSLMCNNKRRSSLKKSEDKATGRRGLECKVRCPREEAKKAVPEPCSEAEPEQPGKTSCSEAQTCTEGGDLPSQAPRPITIPPQTCKEPRSCLCTSILRGQEMAAAAQSRCCCDGPPRYSCENPPPSCCYWEEPEVKEPCEPPKPKEIKYCLRVEVKCDDSCIEIQPNCTTQSEDEGGRMESR